MLTQLIAFDEHVIDRVFQPVINVTGLSPIEVSRFFFCGLILGGMILTGIMLYRIDIAGATTSLFGALATAILYVSTRYHRDGLRLIFRPHRIALWVVIAMNVYWTAYPGDEPKLDQSLALALLILFEIGLYFGACRKPPPRQRRVPVAKGLASARL